MHGLNGGLFMRFSRRVWLPATLLLAASGCATHTSRPERVPITLSQPTPLQRPATVHGRRLVRAARPAPATVAIPSQAQKDETERLFREFVDWQGAHDGSP